MLVSLKKLVEQAHQHKYAVGAFNTSNLEVTQGIIQGAVEMQAPVIIQVSETAIKYAGLKSITAIVETVAKNEAVNIPVALHLDHGRSFRAVAECIEAGFSSIMIDASNLPFDENVTITKQSVEYAHKKGVWAQGELGKISGSEDYIVVDKKDAYFTDPKEAKKFAKQTKVDTLAVSVGNVHGIYKLRKGVPKLNQKRLKEIHQIIPEIPLVLHGASGLPEDAIIEGVKNGIRIINIDTELRLAFTDKLRETLENDKKEYDPRKVLKPSTEAVKKIVKKKIKIFQSEGQAKNFQK
ncbi:MAG: class II fructose-1,6-bisphosphate aldolase [Patescibacteria group bacterium]|nr:class II fructose-1,6-bisphosphate aldolase [Patescibacteria group bacterium]